jgi:hypothetical protein
MSVSHHPCMVKEYCMTAVGRAEFDWDSALTKYMAVGRPPWSAAEDGEAALWATLDLPPPWNNLAAVAMDLRFAAPPPCLLPYLADALHQPARQPEEAGRPRREPWPAVRNCGRILRHEAYSRSDGDVLWVFLTYDGPAGFFRRTKRFFYLPRFFDHHVLKPYY